MDLAAPALESDLALGLADSTDSVLPDLGLVAVPAAPLLVLTSSAGGLVAVYFLPDRRMPPRFFFDEIFLPLELAPTAEPPDELPSSDESSRCSAAASAAALRRVLRLGMVSLRALTAVIDLICSPVIDSISNDR